MRPRERERERERERKWDGVASSGRCYISMVRSRLVSKKVSLSAVVFSLFA